MPLTSGSRLGAYESESPLGSGGMGEVYKARDTKLEDPVGQRHRQADVAGRDKA